MHTAAAQRTMSRIATATSQRPQALLGSPGVLAVRPFASRRLNCNRWPLPVVLVRAEVEKQEEQGAAAPPPQASSSAAPSDEPIWVRRERERELQAKEGKDLPFGVYLLLSAIVAIAAVGSIFEYTNGNPIFGVVQPDSFLWAPILGIFVFTGFPTAGFLFYKAVASANKASEQMDRLDGY